MRYRNVIVGGALGAILGVIFGVIFGASVLSAILALAIPLALSGLVLGLFIGNIDSSCLTIAVEDRQYLPGDTVELEVSLTPEGSFYVREGRVELVCVETTYRAGEEGGYDTIPHVWWQSAASFLHEENVLKRQSYGKTFKFTLPSDAPPSLQVGADEQSCANISWRVQVSLDIAGAQDFHQRREIVVLPLVPEPTTPVPKEEVLDQCAAWLSLSSMTVRGGETFSETTTSAQFEKRP